MTRRSLSPKPQARAAMGCCRMIRLYRSVLLRSLVVKITDQAAAAHGLHVLRFAMTCWGRREMNQRGDKSPD